MVPARDGLALQLTPALRRHHRALSAAGPAGFVSVSSSMSVPKNLEPGKLVKIERQGDAEEVR
jgi:hypothetical protein